MKTLNKLDAIARVADLTKSMPRPSAGRTQKFMAGVLDGKDTIALPSIKIGNEVRFETGAVVALTRAQASLEDAVTAAVPDRLRRFVADVEEIVETSRVRLRQAA